jgi:hypothetical protein
MKFAFLKSKALPKIGVTGVPGVPVRENLDVVTVYTTLPPATPEKAHVFQVFQGGVSGKHGDDTDGLSFGPAVPGVIPVLMTGNNIIEVLRKRGFTLSLDGERQKIVGGVNGPGLTEADRESIRQHKEEIIQELQLQREGPPYSNGRGMVKCLQCGLLRYEPNFVAICKVSRAQVYGISLLIECKHFEMREDAHERCSSGLAGLCGFLVPGNGSHDTAREA